MRTVRQFDCGLGAVHLAWIELAAEALVVGYGERADAGNASG
jgi:hypothetical protein